MNMVKPVRALVSVSNREGIERLAEGLERCSVEIFATRGTAGFLRQAGIRCVTLEEKLGLPELLHGRIKTLREKVLAGVLMRAGDAGEENDLRTIGGVPFQVVVCNFYPFPEKVKKGLTLPGEATELVDIGGVALVRAAAKNWEHAIVLANPSDYESFLSEFETTGGISEETRLRLASTAFDEVAAYDRDISLYFSQFGRGQESSGQENMPQEIALRLKKERALRYGENPDRDGAYYALEGTGFSLSSLTQLSGEGISFTNLLDVTALVRIVSAFDDPVSAVIKHGNPCGVGTDKSLREAFLLAIRSDPVSSYGSVTGFNREVDEETAVLINESGFMEAVVAPSYSKRAAELLAKKSKRRRLLVLPWLGERGCDEGFSLSQRLGPDKSVLCPQFSFAQCPGGFLVQTEPALIGKETLRTVTEKKPSAEEMESLGFAWKVVEHVQSNAVVIAKGKGTVGVGAGQMNRLYSISIALRTAGERAAGAVLASDGFLPMVDNVDECAKGKIASIIQPGGSIRDGETIDACNRLGISMVFTGRRCFKH